MSRSEPSWTARSIVNEIHPVELVGRQPDNEQMVFCLEVVRNSVGHPILTVSHVQTTNGHRELVLRIPANRVVQFFNKRPGKAQAMPCWDDENPPRVLPFVIVEVRLHHPEFHIVATDGWGIRACTHPKESA